MSDIFKGTRLAWVTGDDQDTTGRSSSADPNVLISDVPIRRRDTSAKASVLKCLWLVGGLLTIFLPIFIRNAKLNSFQNNAWAQGAQQMNQAQQYGQYNGGNGQYNQYGQQQQQQGPYFRDVNNCKWWKWGCTPYYVDERGEYISQYEMQQRMYEEQQRAYEEKMQYYQQGGQGGYYNSNYGEGGTQQYGYANGYNTGRYQNQRDQGPEEMYRNSYYRRNSYGMLKFFYAIQIIGFVGIIAFGHSTLSYGGHPLNIVQLLMFWFFLSCVVMILLKTISINGNINPYNLRGYYGQFSVLLFMANEAFAIFSLIGILIFSNYNPNEREVLPPKDIDNDYVNV